MSELVQIRVCPTCQVPMGDDYRCPTCRGALYNLEAVVLDDEDDEPDDLWEVEGPLGTWYPGGSDKPYHIPPGKVAIWSGPPGSGKTSLAMPTLPHAAVCTNEMGHRDYVDYRKRLAATWNHMPARVDVLEFIHADRDYLHINNPVTDAPIRQGHVIGLRVPDGREVDPGEVRELIVDSGSNTPDDAQTLNWVIQWAKITGGRAIVILWQTTQGESWGGNKLSHLGWQDCVLGRDSTGRRTFTTKKDRSNKLGSLIFALPGESTVELTSYVSVEGEPPGYSLRPWPDYTGWSGLSGAKHADVFKAVERSKDKTKLGFDLPDPPCAVAAHRSRLYASGWAEPGDWRDRAAFAINAGAPYFSPVYDRIFYDLDELHDFNFR